MRKGHLITCLNLGEVKNFDQNRYIGVGPFYPDSSSTDRRIGARLRILWDVIADLKRVRPGDICFLHAEGQIFGPYIFRSPFKESHQMPDILRSANITYNFWIKNKAQFNKISMAEYGYVASIDKPKGCNENGSNLMELFLKQSQGVFNGIPPRFMYGDTKKIVKPLLYHEISQLLDIVGFIGDWSLLPGNNYGINGLSDITLDLSDYGGHLYCEKLLEAWFTGNMYPGSLSHKMIDQIFGNYDYYANSIYTYYTNFLDIIVYNIDEGYSIKTCTHCNNVNRDFADKIRVIELKRDYIGDPSWVVDQIEAYIKWARLVLNPKASVDGYIVAAGFGSDYANIKKSKPYINFIQYSVGKNSLTITKL